MADLEFDRAALGVSAKKDWHDARQFADAGKAMDGLTPEAAVKELPSGDSYGTFALLGRVNYFKTTMQAVLREFSDACGVLGSGQESVIANHDETESEVSRLFMDVIA
ncbi:MAG: hypothetical protein CSA83_02925 [Actinomycetales bacterium]|nr:MAG: hypothetical protein CSA83_02925 [Actinomycetales bacterium]